MSGVCVLSHSGQGAVEYKHASCWNIAAVVCMLDLSKSQALVVQSSFEVMAARCQACQAHSVVIYDSGGHRVVMKVQVCM